MTVKTARNKKAKRDPPLREGRQAGTFFDDRRARHKDVFVRTVLFECKAVVGIKHFEATSFEEDAISSPAQ